ncbi:2-dehydro-3-deoxygalactonokinase [Variovorax ginsengisoli]|uniref:2-dehydro-3-deoxygalactonokinase n=1 Tax=Variovorax ginsengisoli TaxID=363844 RepID=A0ABT9S4Z4_9BURK|nr:2-dehydro-3-deoxygalactonokinase [Variovorax ginsengisoli]MDP9899300.1 2-dehydro-3-deoxygalactonokinase [Variovorax ginsengisoli]
MTWIAVDWGTSALRGARLDDEGRVIEERSAARGILSVPAGGFPAVFEELFGDWMRAPNARCLISGMAGSRQGWIEAPYCACPAGLQDVAAHIIPVDGERVRMVPGLSAEHDGVPDVMRGEEVQILGAMALTGRRDGLFVLPGTHNKWATVAEGRIVGFRTFMTGEFYALLSQHSILARTLDAAASLDEAAFLQGVTRAGNGQGLLHNAFGARTLALFERMPQAGLGSYLSGLLIGEELRTASLRATGEVVLIGSPALTQRYALALHANGAATRTLGAEAAWAGLHALAHTA